MDPTIPNSEQCAKHSQKFSHAHSLLTLMLFFSDITGFKPNYQPKVAKPAVG